MDAGLSGIEQLRAPFDSERRTSAYESRDSSSGGSDDPRRPLTPREQRLGLTSDTPRMDELPRGLSPDVAARALVRLQFAERYNEFVRERNALFRQQLDHALSADESKRLSFLRWQLDRIEDAIEGDHLDRVELLVEQHEALGSRIEQLLGRLQDASSTALDSRSKRR